MSIGRNFGYNLLGTVLPIVVALVSVPFYIHLIGLERYGIVGIALMLMGYMGFIDFGLGRSTLQAVAKYRNRGNAVISRIIFSAGMVNIGLGCLGGLAIYLISSIYFSQYMTMASGLRTELMAALPLIAITFPMIIMTNLFSFTLQATGRFVDFNVCQVFNSVSMQVLPILAAVLVKPHLDVVFMAVLVARVLSLGITAFCCHRHILRGQPFRFSQIRARQLLRFGGWVSLAGIGSGFLVITDRLMIGSAMGPAAAGIYNIPMQLASRLVIVPGALVDALFPHVAQSKLDAARQIWGGAVCAILAVMTPICAGLVLVLEPLLTLWVGERIAVEAALPGRILVLAFWGNSLALVPHTGLQATGRPNRVVYAQLFEIVIYFPALYFGLKYAGLTGAALAFALRCNIDHIFLSIAAGSPVMGRKYSVGISILALAIMIPEMGLRLPILLLADGAVVLAVTVYALVVAPASLRQAIAIPLARFLPGRGHHA